MLKEKVYPTKYYIRLIVFIFFSIFIKKNKIKSQLPKEVSNLKSPYLLLCNHVGFWDPFIAGHFLKPFTHFVSSDAAFKNKFFRFFLTRLGTIPKKKNMRDSKVIRDIISVIRQGENVGIFPEAVRTWSGSSFYIDISIVKLIQLLQVPVVVCTLKGMNLFNPRWSDKTRKTKVIAEYKLLLNETQISTLTPKEIHSLILSGIKHDEVEYQRLNMNKITSKHKAESINHAIYLCPSCNEIDSFISSGNEFHCTKCSYDITIDDYGFFKRKSAGKIYFDNIRDWYLWEEKMLIKYIKDKLNNNFKEALFTDYKSKIYLGKDNIGFTYMGEADLLLFIDRIEVRFNNKSEVISFNFKDLQTINPQVKEMLEIMYNDEAYRSVGGRPGVSALKWEVAVNTIWKEMGLDYKLSPYIFN